VQLCSCDRRTPGSLTAQRKLHNQSYAQGRLGDGDNAS
jgi:hypothetical protein